MRKASRAAEGPTRALDHTALAGSAGTLHLSQAGLSVSSVSCTSSPSAPRPSCARFPPCVSNRDGAGRRVAAPKVGWPSNSPLQLPSSVDRGYICNCQVSYSWCLLPWREGLQLFPMAVPGEACWRSRRMPQTCRPLPRPLPFTHYYFLHYRTATPPGGVLLK
jgi:hypothetical protein